MLDMADSELNVSEEDFIELTATKFDYKQQYETDEIVFENTFKKLQTIK